MTGPATAAAPAAPPPEPAPPPKAPPPHAAWNFGVIAADVTCFLVAIAFLDAATVLPALVRDLGGGPLVLGLFAAVKQAGFFLPQLFVAYRLQGRARYLPFLLRVCFWGRMGLFGAAAAIFWLGKPAPGVALLCLGIAYALLWVGDGAGVVPWTGIVGRAIPAGGRGRFFATTQVLGSVGKIGAGLLVVRILGGDVVSFPASGALLVLCCAVLMGLSFLFLVLIREPSADPGGAAGEAAAPAPQPFGRYLQAIPAHLRARPEVARLALAQLLGAGITAAFPFYLGYAYASIPGLSAGIAGQFLIAHTAGGLLCAPLWGWLTDRSGPRTALLAVFLAGLLSPLLAAAGGMVWPGVAWFFASFFFLGAMMEGGWAVFTNYLLEMVPGPEQPTFIGILSTVNAPALVLPLVAGLLVRSFGTPSVLGLALALLLGGFVTARGLPDTRRAGAPPAAR